MFLHANIQHIFFNMFALWMFGCVMEDVWGGKKFLFYYISCGIGAGLFQELAQFVQFYLIAQDQFSSVSFPVLMEIARNSAGVLDQWTTIGASGAIYGVLLAFGMTFPNDKIWIFPLPIGLKAKWFVLFYVVVELFSAISTSADGVAHFAHLGGMAIGFLMIYYWNHHPGMANVSAGMRFFDKMHENFDRRQYRRSQRRNDQTQNQPHDDRNADWDYNARKQQEQQEIDAILDKIRKSGYDSLTAEEKRKLFDYSNK